MQTNKHRKWTTLLPTTYTRSIYVSPKPPKRLAQKFHFTFLRIKVTRASRGLSAIAELLILLYDTQIQNKIQCETYSNVTKVLVQP